MIGAPLPHMQGPRQVAIVRLFGVTSTGSSVCCHVHGFQPYFYAAMPASMTPDDLEDFRRALNVRAAARQLLLASHLAAQDRTGEATSGRQKQAVYVTRVEAVCKQTLWNYQARAVCPARELAPR